MHVFIDDSDTFAKNGFLCLAGFMASDAAWDRFCIRWEELLQKHALAVMHTSHFLSGQGIYKVLGHSFERRVGILSEFLDVIREETECGVFAAVNAGEYREVLRSAKKKLQPEEFLFRRILRRSFDHMVEIKSVESIGFWFDDSEKTSSRFLALWHRTKKNWKFARSMLGSIAFGDDNALPPLQAADVLANVLVRSHSSGVDAWHGQSPFSRLFIDPKTHAVANHIRGEFWEPHDVDRLKDAIIELAGQK
ncbi:MAG: DUF3800 domain-containing protein [Alphaproteobacteria bacterium]|jgi:hypothetical protein|nr:DUF3800 domain-containing protein [Alphaproteobacteria bacterium]